MHKFDVHWQTSKAFDCVDYLILVKILSEIQLPSSVFNWLISYCRSHTPTCSGVESCSLSMNLSIAQGSVLGLTFYNVFEWDLKAVSCTNVIFKYADDIYCLVPEHTDVQLNDGFETILNWPAKWSVRSPKQNNLCFVVTLILGWTSILPICLILGKLLKQSF